jgi:hypothetical protein
MRYFNVNTDDKVIIDVENLCVLVVSVYDDLVRTSQYKYKDLNNLLDTYNFLKRKNLKDLTFKKNDRKHDEPHSYLYT